MQKLYIAKNKWGGYYSKIENKYAGCTKLIAVNLPKDIQLNSNYGTYNCEYYLSCFKRKDESVEFVIVVTKINLPFQPVENPYDVYNKPIDPELPF